MRHGKLFELHWSFQFGALGQRQTNEQKHQFFRGNRFEILKRIGSSKTVSKFYFIYKLVHQQVMDQIRMQNRFVVGWHPFKRCHQPGGSISRNEGRLVKYSHLSPLPSRHDRDDDNAAKYFCPYFSSNELSSPSRTPTQVLYRSLC